MVTAVYSGTHLVCFIVSGEMSVAKYPELAVLLVSLRKAKGWKQKDFATRVGSTQQTISRWEQGRSRPRAKELSNLATILDADLTTLTVAAEYATSESSSSQPEGAPTYDVPLPLHSLRPDSFENFSADFLVRYYRNRGGVVNRFGGTGSKQHGIDIEVRGKTFGVHTFQCKRVEEFGEQKVHRAVAEQTYVSDLKILLLSNIASPKARVAIAQYQDWQMWDRIDISAKFRELSMVDRKDLVDIYFRGQRQALLGETESGPFQKPEDFFKGFTDRNRFFNHAWSLVGREEELDKLIECVSDDNLLVTMLLGAPGNGKTRILREVVERVRENRADLAILFVSPTEDVKAQHLAELGRGKKLLIIDDAHDRDDLSQLMRFATVTENETKLLISLRSYGRAMVRSQASLVAMDSPQVATVEMRARTKQDATVLATQVLNACDGPLETAELIAELTYATPLVTVLAAQIVAKENVPPALIGNSEDFQEHVLSRLEDIIAGRIVTGQDVPKLQAVLRMVALLQPVVFDDPAFLRILREVEGLEHEDAQRLLRLLSEGGVLFKRGLRHRLAPDLMADSIIQRNFIGVCGAVTPKVEHAFKLADAEYLKHLLVNLGRLDWRLRNGDTEGSTLLSSIVRKLQWHAEYHNPHIQAVEAVAYYQPRLALNFAERLIEEGHGDHGGVCGMIRNAVFNPEVLEDGCMLLWRAGRDDSRALNSQPNHGIRILRELAEFEPNKPVAYVKQVVDFAIELLNRPVSLTGFHTPFTILEGALKTEMQEVTSSNRNLTITRYRLDFELAKAVRARVVDVIVNSIKTGSPRKAFLAACLLAEALRGPMHDGEDHEAWDIAHAELLELAHRALDNTEVHPVAVVQAGISVSWHAFYSNRSECRSKARDIIKLSARDLPTRLVRLVGDAWGHQTWDSDESFERKDYEAEIRNLIVDLATEFPKGLDLYRFLNHWLCEIDRVTNGGWGSPHVLVSRLLKDRPDVSTVVLAMQSEGDSPLNNFSGAALAVLMAEQNRYTLMSEILEADSARAWEMVSEAYALQAENFYADADLPILRRIFCSNEPSVLRNAAAIARQVARRNPALAVELICTTNLVACPPATHEFFMLLAHRGTLAAGSISSDQFRILLVALGQLPELDDHWVVRFLKQAVETVPADVVEMLKGRLQLAGRSLGYRSMRMGRSGSGLGLLSHPDGQRLLQELLAWAVDCQNDGKLGMDIGTCITGLCGKYGPQVLGSLLDVLKGGGQAHVNVVASTLRCAHQSFVIDETPYIRELLSQAELVSDKAVKDISSALWASAVSGGRSGLAGEPFKEDVVLKDYAETILKGMSRMDPAYKLYNWLFQHSKENIERQADENRAMELDDE
ncbi:helix-turn-helix domain-containing protein [Pseudomonas sp. DTU12.1]|nr:helix-turn-helix domain-containing protein [Pseudomonas sp. DTU12.1]